MTISSERRLLVTGASGFVGNHVAQAVADGRFGPARMVAWPKIDLRDGPAVVEAVAEAAPDMVIHLAAQSFVPRSFEDPEETLAINLIGTLHLLQGLKAASFTGRLLFVSSGDVYGQVPEDALPVKEIHLPEPRNPYAVSKVAAEHLCLQFGRSEKLDVVIARPFNHIGPGQDARFVVPSIAGQIARVAAQGGRGAVDVGDIDTTRDFTDVRDVVSAYAYLLASGRSGEIYHVASGVERRVRDLLQSMCELADVEVEVRQDPARMRLAEQRRMVADTGKILADTGWVPQISIEKTLNDIINEARNNQ